MLSRGYSLLGTAFFLAFIAQTVLKADAKSITMELLSSESSPTANSITMSPILSLPTRIDDDDLLEEYGRFMTSLMNPEADPCEDFYDYACGNFKRSEFVPEILRNYPLLAVIQFHVDVMLIRFLKNSTDEELKANTAVSKAKMFYSSCMKMNNEVERDFKQIWELEEFKKEWKPSTENETFDWITINFMSSYGVYPLLPLEVDFNYETRKYELLVSPPELLLNNLQIDIKNLTRDFKIEDDVLQKNFVKEFEDMKSFEKRLVSRVSSRNESESFNLKDFLTQHKEDTFKWTRYFNVAFNGSEKSDWIIHYDVEDIKPLVRFLNKTNLETLKNYVKWRTLFKFYNIWKPKKDGMVLESFCLEQTEKYFGQVLELAMIETAFDVDRRADILRIAQHVKETFYDLIDKNSWLDDETKSNAKTKLSAMDIFVGYSDEMRHKELINEEYKNVNMTEDWFTNILTEEAHKKNINMSLVNKVSILPSLKAYEVNAENDILLNRVNFPIAFTQMPVYHIKLPVSLKYADIGNTFGHEMGHGFDSSGYKLNYDGKEKNWWTEGSLRNFKERYRCLESQYNKFIYRGVPANGTLTSEENIADNVGTRASYHAYMKSFGELDGDEKPISSLNFTNKQLFFLKYAQRWCTGADDAAIIDTIKTEVHAYEEFRVRGPLKNMPEFSEVFQCKLGSNMNPLQKCVVW